MPKKNVQVLLTEEEQLLLAEAAVREGTTDMRGFFAGRARALLLAWAFDVLEKRGGVRGGSCGSCSAAVAPWLNTATRLYVCDACAERINAMAPVSALHHAICVRGGPDRQHLPSAVYEKTYRRVLAVEAARLLGGREKLIAELVEAAAALASSYSKDETVDESLNADMIGLFKTS